MTRLIIVGASLAGANAAQALRRHGYDDDLLLIGDESHPPYDRPPLSKDYLTQDYPEQRLTLRPFQEPEAIELSWMPGRRAFRLDTESRLLSVTAIDAGPIPAPPSRTGPDRGPDRAIGAVTESIDFDGLIVATGARPRTRPATIRPEPHPRVVTLRTVEDARTIRNLLATGPARPARVLVCGAGFIGAEVAASARSLGCQVTLVELADAPLTRVLDTESGLAVARLHQGHGVDVRLGTAVEGIVEGRDQSREGVDDGLGRPLIVTLSDGDRINADVVVVGIGVVPNAEWLTGSGLEIDDGLIVDDRCRAATALTAAGDVARWPNARFGGRLMRVEQWDNAVEMGGYAARSLLAELDLAAPLDEPYQPVPWFWSDQYDRKIQLAGTGSDDHLLVQGTVEDQQFVKVFFDTEGRLCGVLAWNRPRQAIIGRQLIEVGADRIETLERLS